VDVFVLLSSLLLFLGSRPGINGVDMGCYHILMKVKFPSAPDLPNGHD